MGTMPCPDCGRTVSEIAPSCPHCGRTLGSSPSPEPAPSHSSGAQGGGMFCSRCGRTVTPLVTSVGGGSCSFGTRERWSCPTCGRLIKRKGCFVATAAYGDEDLIEVHLLRAFRDQCLVVLPGGRALVWAYYRVGPALASLVERSPFLHRTARRSLDWLVMWIERHTTLSRIDIRERLVRTARRRCRRGSAEAA